MFPDTHSLQPPDLIQQIANSDEIAFRQLYDQYKERVYNTCIYYLQYVHEAEEVTQDVFMEVYHSAAGFKGNSSIATWVYRIAVNKCLDRLRYQGRQKRFAFVTSLFHKDTGALLHDAPDRDNPGSTLEKKEKVQVLQRAIQQLPVNQQTAFILKQVEGLSQKEIAEIMNLGEKAVESLIQRAKGNLRKTLEKLYKQSEGLGKP